MILDGCKGIAMPLFWVFYYIDIMFYGVLKSLTARAKSELKSDFKTLGIIFRHILGLIVTKTWESNTSMYLIVLRDAW